MKFTRQQEFQLVKLSESKLAGACLELSNYDIRKSSVNRSDWKIHLIEFVKNDFESWVVDGKVKTLDDLNSFAPLDLAGASKVAEDINAVSTLNSKVESGLKEISDLVKRSSNINSAILDQQQKSSADIEKQLSKAKAEIVSIQKPDQSKVDTAINQAVAVHFEKFKQTSTPEQIKVAASQTSKYTIKKAGEVFGSENCVYEIDGNKVDFSDYPCEVFGESKVVDSFYIFPPEHLHQCLIALDQDIPHNCWLGGQRGTGKSQFVENFAGRLGRPFERINFDQTSDRDLVGGFQPDPDKPPLSWQAGAVGNAVKKAGCIILLDEVSMASESNLAALHCALERVPSRGFKVTETGESIPVAHKVSFFAADNTFGQGDESGNYGGTNAMNQAFIDRFCFSMEFNYLPKEKEISLLVSKSGCSLDVAEQIVEFSVTARQKTLEGILTMPPSTRQLFGIAHSLKKGLPPSLAFKNSILNKYPSDCYPELLAIFESKVDVKKLQGLDNE